MLINSYLKISIITPALNSVKYIEYAIQSVLAQNHPNFEHIIIDGGSTDGTLNILKKYSHLKWVSESDKGQSDAMNKGFKLSTGDIIVYLNADDYFLPNAFNTVIHYFLSGSSFVVGKVQLIGDAGPLCINDPKIEFAQMLKWWETDAYCYNPVGYFYRREVQEAVGGFDIFNHYSMDVQFLIEASLQFPFTKTDTTLGVYRLIVGTKTSNTSSCIDELKKLSFCNKYLKYLDTQFIKDYKKEKRRYLYKRMINEQKNLIHTLLNKVKSKLLNLNNN